MGLTELAENAQLFGFGLQGREEEMVITESGHESAGFGLVPFSPFTLASRRLYVPFRWHRSG
jgi:hypothetical protein